MPLHDTLFTLANIAILPFWALMILAPRWNVTDRVMRTLWPVVLVATLYLIAIFSGGVDFSRLSLDLNGIADLLGSPGGAATAWLHMLAFDLFVGRWAYLDSRERNLPVWITSPALFFVLLMGPFGLLLYLAGRGWWERRR